MKKHSMPEMKEGGVNVTPLIDVVMCLIVFFMLVAKIGVTSGDDNSITIPSLYYGTDIRDKGNLYTLNVARAPGGNLARVVGILDGKMQDLTIGGDNKSPTSLRNVLAYFRNGDPGRGIPPNPDFKVVIRGEESLPFSALAPVLVECAAANCKSFAFAGKPTNNLPDETDENGNVPTESPSTN